MAFPTECHPSDPQPQKQPIQRGNVPPELLLRLPVCLSLFLPPFSLSRCDNTTGTAGRQQPNTGPFRSPTCSLPSACPEIPAASPQCVKPKPIGAKELQGDFELGSLPRPLPPTSPFLHCSFGGFRTESCLRWHGVCKPPESWGVSRAC